MPSLKPLLDAYGGPYKDRYRFWTGVTLLLRLIVTIIFSFTSGEVAKINTSVISTAILGIFLSWSFMSAVYRNVYLSVLEVAFLTNLFLLSNLSNAASLIKLYILQKFFLYLYRTVYYLLYNHHDCALRAENVQQAYKMLHTQKKTTIIKSLTTSCSR